MTSKTFALQQDTVSSHSRELLEELKMKNVEKRKIREFVMQDYRKIALANNFCGCMSSSCCDASGKNRPDILSETMGYSDSELNDVPEGSNMGLGCGNPHAIITIQQGETVLDLGSGGGVDCFIASKRVGNTGKVIGVDMTPEMVSKARANAEEGEYSNIEFRLGEIENLPVADSIINVIISNCVINLSPEKEKVFREAFRVLKPGGRLAISDIVSTIELSDNIKKDFSSYSGCIAGASSIDELYRLLQKVGFSKIHIEPNDKSRELIMKWMPNERIENYIVSAYIEAVK